MTSPFLPCPFTYSDAPQGGSVMPMIIAGRNPSNTIDINYASGYLWLSDLSQGGSGDLYYQGGHTAGSPNWTLLFSGASSLDTLSDGTNTVSPSGGDIEILGTINQITSTGSNVTHSITLSIPSVFVAPGSITSTTTLTATLGNITATNGNIVKGTAGNKDIYTSVATTDAAGANSAGTVTLAGGTATIATTAVTANSIIRIYRQGIGSTGAAALGILTIGTITPGTSFVINSVDAADATALQATDVSVIAWEIVN